MGVVSTTLSAGIAQSTGLETLQSLIARADEALYEAKAAGRNRIRTAGPVRPADAERSAHPIVAAPPLAEGVSERRPEMVADDARPSNCASV
jgi:hypothetical protein